MSKTIDQKVVEMRFDNSNFEKNVSTTMSTIDKLKKSLNFNGVSKGLDAVTAATKRCDMSGIGNSVDTISAKFSALQVMAVTALANITNSAINAGKRLVSAFTVQPVITGFQEYELKMNSVQTIMASTGESLETVNQYLQELNEYSDRTIYSFSDMTQNIGKFTNAGVKLEDAVLAIKGISNEAAVSGANANEASRAMYNFAQALSAGYVKLIDWKSIENANMATVEFKQQLIDTAVEIGTLTKTTDGMYKTLEGNTLNTTRNFNDTLQDQWMTTEVLVNTLKDYADETTEIGKKAYSSAQDVKTLTMLMDTLKEAAQSGWAQSWEIIVGDFNEAKTLFTELSEHFGAIIEKSAKARNNLLEGALGGGNGWSELITKVNDTGIATDDFKNKLIDVAKEHGVAIDQMITDEGSFENTLKNGWLTSGIFSEAIGQFVNSTSEVATTTSDATAKLEEFRNVVNKVIKGDFKNGQKRAEALTKAGYDYAEVQSLVNKVLAGGTIELSDLSSAQLESIGLTEEQIATLQDLQKQASETGTPINKLIDSMSKPTGRELLIDTFRNALEALNKVIGSVKKAWDNTFNAMTSKDLYNIIEKIHEFSESLIISDESADNLQKTFEGLFAAFQLVHSVISTSLTGAIKLLSAILKVFDTDIFSVTASLAEYIIKFRDWVEENTIFINMYDKLAKIIKNVADRIHDLIKKFMSLSVVQENIARFSEAFKNTFFNIKNWFGEGIDKFDEFTGRIKSFDFSSFDGFKRVFKDFKDNVLSHFTSFGKVFDSLKEAFKKFKTDGLNAISGFSEGFKNKFSGVLETLKNFGSKIWETLKNIVSNCIDFIKNIDFGTVLAAGLSITTLLIAKKVLDIVELLVSPIKAINKISDSFDGLCKSISKYFKASDFEKNTKAIMNMAIAISILAASIWLLAQLDSRQLWESVGAIAALSAIIGVMSIIAIKANKIGDFGKASVNILAISGSLLIIAMALKQLSEIEQGNLDNMLISLAAMVGALTLMLFVFGKLGNFSTTSQQMINKAGIMLLAMSGALLIMTIVIKQISKLDAGDILKGIAAIGALELLFAGMIAVSSLAGKHAAKAGAMLLLMSGAFLAMFLVIKKASKLSADDVSKAIEAMALVGILFSALIAASNLAGRNAIKAGAMLLLMSGAFATMVTVIKQISGIDPEYISKGLEVVKQIGLIFAALIAASNLAGRNAIKAGAMLLSMSGALLVLTGVIYLLSKIDPSGLNQAIKAVAVLEILFAGLIAVSKLAGKCKSVLITLVVAVSLLSVALAALSFIEPDKLEASTKAMAIVMTIFGLIIAAINLTKGIKVAPLLIMIGAIAALAGIIAALSQLEVDDALDAAASISLLLLSISASMIIASKAGPISMKAVGALALMGLVVGELAVILGSMSHFNINPSIEIAKSLSILLLSMSASLVILGAVGVIGPAAFIGIGALATLIAGIGTLIVAIGALMYDFPMLESFLNKGIPIIEKSGYAIGSFFGNIAGGFIGNMSNGLPAMATDLSNFITNLKGFIDGAKNIDESIVNNIKSLASAILTLTAADIINGVSSWLMGGSSLREFAEQLVPFGDAMVEFSDTVSGKIDETSVTAAANAGKMLAEMASTIPNSGSTIIKWFSGEKDLAAFSDQLDAFGQAIIRFSNRLTLNGGINEEAITAAANAGKLMVELANSLPNSGSTVVKWFSGEKDLVAFSDQLDTFGQAIIRFSNRLTLNGGINEEAITAAANAGSILVELANSLPNSGSTVVKWFSGEKDLAAFGQQLVSFGEAIVKFSGTVSGHINEEAITAASNAGAVMVEFANTLPKTGGVVSWFTGSNDLETFGKNLVAFGENFAAYSESIKNVDSNVVTVTSSAAASIIQLANSLPKDGGWFSDDMTLADFGKDLSSFGSKFFEFYNKISGIDPGQLSGTVAEIKNIVNLINSVAGLDISGISSFATALSDLANSGIDEFVKIFENSDSKVKQAISELVLNFINAVNSSKSSFSNAFISLLNTVLTSIRNKYNSFYSAGSYLVDGFALGIDKSTFKAEVAAAAMAGAALNAAKDTLGIHSPSKEFEKIGIYAIEGIIKGFKETSSQLSTSTKNVGNRIVDTLKEIISRKMDWLEDCIDVQPTIRPVVDMSDAESKVQKLNAMFSREQAMSISSSMNRKSNEQIQNGEKESSDNGNTYNFTQNNYSPKALSRLEIYRQTKNQFSALKGTVKV